MRLIVLSVLIICAGVSTGCAPSTVAESAPDVPTTASGPTGEQAEFDTYSLISFAFAEGRIDYSTSLLYKVYAMFDPLSLPSEYRSEVPGKCGTPLISEVQRNWARLNPADQAEISQYIEPIGEIGSDATQLDDVTPDRLDRERTAID